MGGGSINWGSGGEGKEPAESITHTVPGSVLQSYNVAIHRAEKRS